MLFSIIVTNYNKGKYIKKCLDSIINQTIDKEKYELIVVDDGSADGSIEIIKEYSIKLLYTDRLLAGGARNKGLDNAKGDYIIFIDGDDYLYRCDILSELESIIDNQDVIYLPFIKVKADGSIKILNDGKMNINDRIENDKSLAVCSKCWKREMLSDIRFQEKVYYEDILFILNAYCKIEKEGYLNTPFYVYETDMDGITKSETTLKKQVDIYIQLFGLFELIDRYPKYKTELLRRIERARLQNRMEVIIKLIETEENDFKKHFK